MYDTAYGVRKRHSNLKFEQRILSGADTSDNQAILQDTQSFVYSPQWRRVHYLISIVQNLYAGLLLAILINDIVNEGFSNQIVHWTKWVLTFQILYYFTSSFILCGNPRGRGNCPMQFGRCIVAWCLLPLLGVILSMVIGVIIMLISDSDAEINFWDHLFEEYPDGLVILGNEIYHFDPLLIIILHILVNNQLIFYSLNWWYVEKLDEKWKVYSFTIWNLFFATLVLLLAYWMTLAISGVTLFDVYGIDVHVGIGVIVGTLTSLIFVGSILLCCCGCYGLRRKSKYYMDVKKRPYDSEYQRRRY